MKLYDAAPSGNCYKVRLMLALLGIEHEVAPVDLMAGEHKAEPFLALNPLGQVPVLTDGDLALRDSQAILLYLGMKHGGGTWFPADPGEAATVAQWLPFAAHEIQMGPSTARLIARFKIGSNLEAAHKRSRAVLDILDARLRGHDWLALAHPTIADIACYPYVAIAPEGDIDLSPYAGVSAWMARIEAMPGYVTMYQGG